MIQRGENVRLEVSNSSTSSFLAIYLLLSVPGVS